jgi:hypothetical protein
MMTKITTSAQLCRFMLRVHEFLGQPRWLIQYLEDRNPGPNEMENDDLDAETEYSILRQVVTVWINDRVYDKSHNDQIRIMVHEALHSIHIGIDRLFYSDHVIGLMRDHEHEALSGFYHTQRELMVDQLSLSLMDLPVIKKFWKEEISY